jgi:aminopeptidase N
VVAVDSGSFYGVEYPGLILMQDRTVASGKRLESTVVHEVAHQWFYNLVGNDVQAEPWVDESLATYAQVIYRRAYGGEDAAQRELAELQQQYDRLIERELDGPVHQHMRAYTLYTFNVLAYAKGALFYEALRAEIGSDAFDRMLTNYVTRYRYTMADSTSMRDVATTICACAVDALFATWIHPSLQRRLP